MRHFDALFNAGGVKVDYIYLDQEDNTGSFSGEIKRALERNRLERLVVTEPVDESCLQDIGLQDR